MSSQPKISVIILIGKKRSRKDRIKLYESWIKNTSLLHYAVILEHDWCPVKLGLTTEEDKDHAYMQCVDPGRPYTEGGTVIFKCSHLNRTTRLHKINTEERKMKNTNDK